MTFSVYSDPQLTQLVGSFYGPRPSATTTATTSFASNLNAYPAGTYYVAATAFSNTNTSQALASGVIPVVVTSGANTAFMITMDAPVAEYKLTGAVTGAVTVNGTVIGSPTLTVPAGGWDMVQEEFIEPVDATGANVVLLAATSNLAVTTSSNLAVNASSSLNLPASQFSVGITPFGVYNSSFVNLTYANTTYHVPITVTAPIVNVSVTIPSTLSTVPTTTSASANPLVKVSSAALTDSSSATYSPSSWSISGGSVTVNYVSVTDNNLPFSSTATVQLQDQASTWHTLMTASRTAAATLGSFQTFTLGTGAVGNLTMSNTALGNIVSGSWPTSWGVTATVGGTQASFSPSLFGLNGTPTLTLATLTGTWPNITAATLTGTSAGSVSIPITFNNGASSNPTAAVTASIQPPTGNGSGTIN